MKRSLIAILAIAVLALTGCASWTSDQKQIAAELARLGVAIEVNRFLVDHYPDPTKRAAVAAEINAGVALVYTAATKRKVDPVALQFAKDKLVEAGVRNGIGRAEAQAFVDLLVRLIPSSVVPAPVAVPPVQGAELAR